MFLWWPSKNCYSWAGNFHFLTIFTRYCTSELPFIQLFTERYYCTIHRAKDTLYSLLKDKTPPTKEVSCVWLNLVVRLLFWWSGECRVPRHTITSRCTLTKNDNISLGLIFESNRSISKLFVLNFFLLTGWGSGMFRLISNTVMLEL